MSRGLICTAAVAATLGAAAGATGADTPPERAAWGSVTTLASVNSAEEQQAEDFNDFPVFAPAISADGRYVAFVSTSTNLVAGDTNNDADVFVRDRVAGVTRRVSVGPGHRQANRYSFNPAISADGRHVAFKSLASNLVAGDTNGEADVFVRDRQTKATRRVSVGLGHRQADHRSGGPAISADGRHVAFNSRATNLVAGDTNRTVDVFVRDRQSKATRRVSIGPNGRQGNDESTWPAVSADGQQVAFTSRASNLVAGDTNRRDDVFVRDRQSKVTRRVSIGLGHRQANRYSYQPAISADGRHVAFLSLATNLVPQDTNGVADIFVRNRGTGVTRRASIGTNDQQANFPSIYPAISADGQHVAFFSYADNLVPQDTNFEVDVFVRNRRGGAG